MHFFDSMIGMYFTEASQVVVLWAKWEFNRWCGGGGTAKRTSFLAIPCKSNARKFWAITGMWDLRCTRRANDGAAWGCGRWLPASGHWPVCDLALLRQLGHFGRGLLVTWKVVLILFCCLYYCVRCHVGTLWLLLGDVVPVEGEFVARCAASFLSRAPRDELIARQKFSCILPLHTRSATARLRTRFGLGHLAPSSCVGPWCCQNCFGQFKFVYPFTSSYCGIFSRCDNAPMMPRRVFHDFDVPGHQRARHDKVWQFGPVPHTDQAQLHSSTAVRFFIRLHREQHGFHSCEVIAVNGKEGKFPLISRWQDCVAVTTTQRCLASCCDNSSASGTSRCRRGVDFFCLSKGEQNY